MKVILLKDQRIAHKAGEIVEVSPVIYDFLITNNVAKPAGKEQAKRNTTKKEK